MISLIHEVPWEMLRGCRSLTCRERKLQLLLHDLQGNEVMLLVEAAVVEQQGVPVLGGKPVGRAACHTVKDPRAMKIHRVT